MCSRCRLHRAACLGLCAKKEGGWCRPEKESFTSSLPPLSLQFRLYGGCLLRSIAGRAISTCTISGSFSLSFAGSGSRRCCRSSPVRRKPAHSSNFSNQVIYASSKDTSTEAHRRPVDQAALVVRSVQRLDGHLQIQCPSAVRAARWRQS